MPINQELGQLEERLETSLDSSIITLRISWKMALIDLMLRSRRHVTMNKFIR